MTKSRDNKQAIRAYMRTHGVNYTTAKRELAKQRAAQAAVLSIDAASLRNHHGPLDPTANVTLDVDLTSRCVCDAAEQHTGHRDDCPERLKAFPPRTPDETAGIVGPPVTLDMTRASFAERVHHPHIHDLDGRCAKNRNGNFCGPAPRVVGGVDPDPNYVHTILHRLNTPTRRDALKAALATGDEDTLNAHLREHAPGPHIDDLHAALEQLASDELALREHTDDPESPITYEMLRHAILATTTHGTRWGGGKWHPTAADVCRAYLLGIEVTTSADTPKVDGQYKVWPEDLAATIEALADDESVLDEAAHGTAADADDIAEELLILAHELSTPITKPVPPPSLDDEHYLTVTEGARYVDRRFIIDCTNPTTGQGSCEGWEECDQCRTLTINHDAYDELLDTGQAHGLEHVIMNFGPAIRTGKCALQAFPEAWEESDAIHGLPPGRYAITSKWEDEYCTIWLRTH